MKCWWKLFIVFIIVAFIIGIFELGRNNPLIATTTAM